MFVVECEDIPAQTNVCIPPVLWCDVCSTLGPGLTASVCSGWLMGRVCVHVCVAGGCGMGAAQLSSSFAFK